MPLFLHQSRHTIMRDYVKLTSEQKQANKKIRQAMIVQRKLANPVYKSEPSNRKPTYKRVPPEQKLANKLAKKVISNANAIQRKLLAREESKAFISITQIETESPTEVTLTTYGDCRHQWNMGEGSRQIHSFRHDY